MTSQRAIDNIITIDQDGNLIQIDKQDTPIRGAVLSSVTRGLNIEPNFLYDNYEYIAYDKKKNGTFVQMHQQAYQDTKSPLLKAIVAFYANSGADTLTTKIGTPNEDNKNNYAFRIFHNEEYKYPHEDTELINYYSQKIEQKNTQNITVKGQCSITGKNNQPIINTSHRLIKGFKGGRTSGTAIYSNNMRCTEDNNKTQLQSSSISLEADKHIVKALEALLNTREHNMKSKGDKSYCYWFGDSLEQDFNLYTACYSNNIEDINTFMKDYRKTKDYAQNIEDVDCNIIEISCKTTRPHYKFYSFKTSTVKKNIADWYENSFVDEKYIGLYHAINSLELKNQKTVKEIIEDDLIHSIIFGTNTKPITINAVNHVNSSFRGPFKDKSRKHLSHERMALINYILIRNNMNKEINAYIFGQLLALVDTTQKEARGEVNTNFSSRHYNFKNYFQVYNQIVNNLRINIDKIKKNKPGLGYFFEKQFKELTDQIEMEKLNKKPSDVDRFWQAKGFYDYRLKPNNTKNETTESETEISTPHTN